MKAITSWWVLIFMRLMQVKNYLRTLLRQSGFWAALSGMGVAFAITRAFLKRGGAEEPAAVATPAALGDIPSFDLVTGSVGLGAGPLELRAADEARSLCNQRARRRADLDVADHVSGDFLVSPGAKQPPRVVDGDVVAWGLDDGAGGRSGGTSRVELGLRGVSRSVAFRAFVRFGRMELASSHGWESAGAGRASSPRCAGGSDCRVVGLTFLAYRTDHQRAQPGS